MKLNNIGNFVKIGKALCFLLEKEYFKTFIVIDGLNQNPDGLNFYEWLLKNNLIDSETMELVKKELSKEKE